MEEQKRKREKGKVVERYLGLLRNRIKTLEKKDEKKKD